jgi:hypothetical protein
VKPHDFGALPVYLVRCTDDMHVMKRIYDVLVALFNREVSITWSLDQLAYAMLTLKLDSTELNKVVVSEAAALKLTPTESAEFVSPNPQAFEPLFKDSERLKNALYEVIQAMAHNAAAVQTQNARQSAEAKRLDGSPMKAMLSSFAWPVRDTLETLIRDLKRYRNEPELEVTIEDDGPEDVSLEDVKQQIEAAGEPAVPETQE